MVAHHYHVISLHKSQKSMSFYIIMSNLMSILVLHLD